VRRPPEEGGEMLDRAVDALFEAGESWSVGSSYGAVYIPTEAASPDEALRAADRRMYANKAGRSSASRQLTDVLLRVLDEQSKDIDAHALKVAELAEAVARELGEPRHEVERIRLAATLHDIGKSAIPATILNRGGPLDEQEWDFVRQHPLIGERIVAAAPALAGTAALIRASHERLDGEGYPDGLAGDRIPLGARIISVCDAFEAMTSTRPYREAVGDTEALAELRRCAGTQFDPVVVDALTKLVEGQRDPLAKESSSSAWSLG
jgi:putative nucleotidyltransferase with HDIG domain